jgi:predicted ribosomally synthesized peptide with nif11-like leader
LQEKLKAASDPEGVVAIAKEAGFVFPVETVNALSQEKELSDEELENVVGGNGLNTWEILDWMELNSLNNLCKRGLI